MKFPDPIPPGLLVLRSPEPAGVRFRQATSADLHALHRACYVHLPFAHFRSRFQFGLQEQSARRRVHLLAELNSQETAAIVGTGQIISYTGNVAEIANLVVAAPWRDRGIGTAIITLLLRLAEEAGAVRVEIGVEADNVGALSLYRRLGFEPARELPLPGKGTALVLEMRLSSSPEPLSDDANQ